MDISFISQLIIPIVLVVCLVVGYIIKKWIKDVDNKFIPTILAILGAVIAVIVNKDISVTSIAAGALTGLASTGLHQLFTQYIDKAKWNQVSNESFEELTDGRGEEENEQ